MVILFSLYACICVFMSLDDSSLDDSAFSTESSEQVSESAGAPESPSGRPKPRPRPSKEESPPSVSSRLRTQTLQSYCLIASYQMGTSSYISEIVTL